MFLRHNDRSTRDTHDEAVYWLSFAFTPAFLIATLVVLYVAYLKLKEKELR